MVRLDGVRGGSPLLLSENWRTDFAVGFCNVDFAVPVHTIRSHFGSRILSQGGL